MLAFAKARVKKLPGAIRLAYKLRPQLVRLVGERWASLLINSPDDDYYRSARQAPFEQRAMVSVVVPSFNCEAYLDTCLLSVARQDYPQFECIVVDDCSTDASLNIARRWAGRDARFRLVAHRENGGLSAARNTGVLNARGEYVTFLDAVGIMYEGALSMRMQVALENESQETAGSYCGWEQGPQLGCKIPESRGAPDLAVVDFTCASSEWPFSPSVPVAKRSLVLAVGGFDESAGQPKEWQLWYELLRSGYRFVPTKTIGVGYRQKCESTTGLTTEDGSSITRLDQVVDRYTSELKEAVSADTEHQRAPHAMSLRQPRAYDVLFFPHSGYHAWTANSIMQALEAEGLCCACVDLTYAYGNTGVKAHLRQYRVDSITLNEYLLMNETQPKAVVCFNDWEPHVVRPLIERCNDEGIATIGIVEGVQDFDDSDTGRIRRPYRTVRHVFLAGRYDRKFFRGAEQCLYEVGLPRIDQLLQEPVRLPESPLVVVNQNFTYGVLVEHAERWLESVVRACASASLPYVVSQHPADHTNLDGYESSELDMYELIRRGSAFVSRFSTGILESLALGKPVVYHNPHGERVDKFQDGMGVYRMTESVQALTKELLRLKEWKGCVRRDAREFLDTHCHISNGTPAAVTAARHIREIVGA